MASHHDAIVCDLAETYGIYDYLQFRGTYIATLVSGLRPSSRLHLALSGSPVNQTEMLLASVLDGVNLLVWAQSEDARHGRNRPKRVTDLLLKNNEKDDFDVYETPEAFEAARRAILEKNMKEG